jgi:hypothetical protein
MNSHMNAAHNSIISNCYCVPTTTQLVTYYIYWRKTSNEASQLLPLLPPCLFLNTPVHMSNSTTSECPLFSCGPDKAFCYILQGAYKTELSMNTLYELCARHMQYFITLLMHQNFSPCNNPTSLMDMPVPIGTFHTMSLITETYAIYIHIHNYYMVYL